MNTQLTRLFLKRTSQLVCHARTCHTPEVIPKITKALEILPSSKMINSTEDLSKVFDELAERKTVETTSSHSKNLFNIKLTFRTYNLSSGKLTYSEIWYFEIGKDKTQTVCLLTGQTIKTYLLAVINAIKEVSKKNTVASSKNQKSSFTDYQIQYNCQQVKTSLFQNKMSLEFRVMNHILTTKILCNSLTEDITQNRIAYGRKLSSDTNCTDNSKSQQKIVRRMSLFSYYDEESEVTILTNDNTGFDFQFEEESIVVEELEEEEEAELLEIEEDQKLRQFREALKELTDQISNLEI